MAQLTPLMVDIYRLSQTRDNILDTMRLDDLPSYPHVRLIGLFLGIYHCPEILAQITWLQKPQSEGGGLNT